MTEGTDAAQAERLARLNQRRTPEASAPPDNRPSPTSPTGHHRSTNADGSGPVFEPPSWTRADPTAPGIAGPNRTRPAGRRRSPASTAKIVTVGASTTAVLGMMAGYGIADHAAAGKPVLLTADEAASIAIPGATVPVVAVPAATAPPDLTAPPQVIVVVIDAATGQPISGDFDLSKLAAAPPDAAGTPTSSGQATGTPTAANPAPVAAPTTAPAPVAAPAAVDLAVPAPPPPPAPAPAAAPQPAAAPAPAAAPQPQATSSGS